VEEQSETTALNIAPAITKFRRCLEGENVVWADAVELVFAAVAVVGEERFQGVDKAVEVPSRSVRAALNRSCSRQLGHLREDAVTQRGFSIGTLFGVGVDREWIHVKCPRDTQEFQQLSFELWFLVLP